MLDDLPGERRAREQPPEPFRASPIKAALAEWRVVEILGEVVVERIDQIGRDRVGDHAPALLEQQPGPTFDLRRKSWLQVTHPYALLVTRLAEFGRPGRRPGPRFDWRQAGTACRAGSRPQVRRSSRTRGVP